MSDFLEKITLQNGLNFIEVQPLSGGDINEVLLLKCVEGYFVVKLNNTIKFPGMFAAEAKGLQLLEKTTTFKIPLVIGEGEIKDNSYLLMEYISIGPLNSKFSEVFAENLAKLHKTTQQNFGLEHDNYIGSLPQKNKSCETASEFYITQRLEPQLRMASENGFHFKNIQKLYKNISEEIPEEAPSLIHGDLWRGNYMISENGNPVLIDPAVAFAPREMDLAMMKLFGGFHEEVFNNYNSIFPIPSGWKERVILWQLYYLLVHLNLFGHGYLSQVQTAISKYV